MDAGEFNRELGAGLRALRMARGLSLRDVQEKSSGRWRMATLRSYEVGVRAIAAEDLDGLAGFYGVRAVTLIPAPR